MDHGGREGKGEMEGQERREGGRKGQERRGGEWERGKEGVMKMLAMVLTADEPFGCQS